MTERSRSHRVRRIALRVVVFLLLGTIVNVAVAWGCSWFQLPTYTGSVVTPLDEFWPEHLILRDEYVGRHAGMQWSGFGLSEVDLHILTYSEWLSAYETRDVPLTAEELAEQLDIYHENVMVQNVEQGIELRQQLHGIRRKANRTLELRVAAGWPMRSVQGLVPAGTPSLGSRAIELYPDGRAFCVARTMGGKQFVRALPYKPLVLGFAVNAAFYAAILGLLFAAPGRVRRRRRSKRGLCPKCAYPAGASEVCTECGASLKPKRSSVRRSLGLPPPATPAEARRNEA
jgi:hypothetical protein